MQTLLLVKTKLFIMKKNIIIRRTISGYLLFIFGCLFSHSANSQVTSFTTVNDTFNVGDTITFTNTSTGFIGTTLFTWDFDNGDCDTLPYLNCQEQIGGLDSVQHIFRLGGELFITLSANDAYSNVIDTVILIYINPDSTVTTPPNPFRTSCDNYVPNGSFEFYDSDSYNNTEYLGYLSVVDWFCGDRFRNLSSPDYYNTSDPVTGQSCTTCNWQGQSEPRTGSGFAGLATYQIWTNHPNNPNNYREYLFNEIDPLDPGTDYLILFFAKLAENSTNFTEVQATISDVQPTTYVSTTNHRFGNILDINASISSSGIISSYDWMPVFGKFHSLTGSETILTIGNFKYEDSDPEFKLSLNQPHITDPCDGTTCPTVQFRNDNLYPNYLISYYYIDDVSILKVEDEILICKESTSSDCSGSTWTLTVDNPQYSNYLWSNGETTSSINVTITGTSPITFGVLSFLPSGCVAYGSVTIDPANFVSIAPCVDITICPGQTVDLTAYGAATFEWSTIADGIIGSGSAITVSPTAETVYQVTGQCGTLEATAEITVHLNSAKSIDILATATSYCPDAGLIRLFAIGGVSGLVWTPTTGIDGNNTGPTISVDPDELGTGNITYTVSGYDNGCLFVGSITINYVNDCGELLTRCDDCIPSFSPEGGKKYVLSCWVSQTNDGTLLTYNYPKVNVRFITPSAGVTFSPKGEIIDGWQRIEEVFDVPLSASEISLELLNTSSGTEEVYFDDIRVFPLEGEMKTFVYDPEHLRFVCELDENNYGTFYEYDEEGRLARVKKETERGIMTIQEGRTSLVKK